MNEHEIARLAAALHQARPDWPTKQLTTLMSDPRMVDRPRRDVFVALAWVACESGTASPYRVLESGPWWKAAAIEGTASDFQPLKPTERCKTCGKSEHDCRRNPWADHEFEVDVFRAREVDITPVIAELKGHLEPSPAPVHTPQAAQAARAQEAQA